MLRHDRYDLIKQQQTPPLSPEQLSKQGLLRIHPSFRVVAIGIPPERDHPWVTSELMSMFPYMETLPELTSDQKMEVVASVLPPLAGDCFQAQLLRMLRDISDRLSSLQNDPGSEVRLSAALSSSSLTPSCRQLLRLWRGARNHLVDVQSRQPDLFQSNKLSDQADPPLPTAIRNDLRHRIHRMFMVPFMPLALRTAFDDALISAGLSAKTVDYEPPNHTASIVRSISERGPVIRIGTCVLPVSKPDRPELVPDTHFVDVPAHVSYMEALARDIRASEKHILLIGNQGRLPSISLLPPPIPRSIAFPDFLSVILLSQTPCLSVSV